MKKKLLGLLVVVLLLSAGAFAEVIYSQDFEDNKMPDDFLVVEGSWRVVNGQLIGESSETFHRISSSFYIVKRWGHSYPHLIHTTYAAPLAVFE
jgi:hypothetical protein